jgi:hypothetical protein
MPFRDAETRFFPFCRIDKGIWYFILCDNEITEYKSTRTDRKSLIPFLKSLISNKKNFKVFGVWTGQWSTDIFVLDASIAIEELSKK